MFLAQELARALLLTLVPTVLQRIVFHLVPQLEQPLVIQQRELARVNMDTGELNVKTRIAHLLA